LERLKKPKDLVESVRNSLFDAILTGILKPGEKLRQEQLAERLGVSRQPVSHALRILADQGILTEFNSQSLQVAEIDKEMMMQILDVRIELDSYAARLAAERVKAGWLGPDDKAIIGRLEKLVRDHSALTTICVKQSVQDDIEFHHLIRKLSGNRYIHASLAPHILHHHRLIYLIGSQRNQQIWSDHKDIMTAITNGDGPRARSLVRAHINVGAKTLKNYWATKAD